MLNCCAPSPLVATKRRSAKLSPATRILFGAGGLTLLISANAVQSAPVDLAAISVGALAHTAASASAVIATTKAIAMTTLQKTAFAATGWVCSASETASANGRFFVADGLVS
jgi:hypothetical protein